MDKKNLVISIIAVLLIGGVAYYLGTQQGLKQGEKTGYEKGEKDTEAAYKELIGKAETPVVNPMENLPSTNPFEGVNSNPFAEVKTNPFK